MVQLKLDEKVGGRNCKGTRETKISIGGHDLDGESITWWHFHTRVNSSWKWRRLVKARASISNRDVRFHETRCHINRSDKIYSWLDTRSPSNFRRRDRHHLSLVFIELIKRIGCTPNNFSSPRRIQITISKVKLVSSWRFLSILPDIRIEILSQPFFLDEITGGSLRIFRNFGNFHRENVFDHRFGW